MSQDLGYESSPRGSHDISRPPSGATLPEREGARVTAPALSRSYCYNEYCPLCHPGNYADQAFQYFKEGDYS